MITVITKKGSKEMGVIAELIRAGVDPDLIERVVEWGRPIVARSAHAEAQARYKARKASLVISADQRDHRETDPPAAVPQAAPRGNQPQQAKPMSSSVISVISGDRATPPPSPLPEERSPIPPKELTLTLTPPSNPGIPTTRARARTLIAADASPEPAQTEFAYSSGLDDQQVRAEWEQFRDHHRSRGNLMLDWHSAWRTWVRNCNKYKARAGPYTAGRSNGSAELTRWVLEGIEDDKRRREESGSTVVPMLPVNRGCY